MQRYFYITRKNSFYILSHKNAWTCFLFTVGLLCSIIITLDIFINDDIGGSKLVCKLSYSKPVSTCRFDISCIHYITGACVTFVVVTCSWIIIIATRKLKTHIEKEEKMASKVLGIQRITNVERLQATHYLWIGFLVTLLPWGVSSTTQIFFDQIKLLSIITWSCQIFAHLSFLTLPLVYLKMDRYFSKYVKRTTFEIITLGILHKSDRTLSRDMYCLSLPIQNTTGSIVTNYDETNNL